MSQPDGVDLISIYINDELIAKITTEINNLKKSFQDGVDILYNKCVSLGTTPVSKSPNDISNAIGVIYNSAYSAGRAQGREDVKANPGAYGIVVGGTYTISVNGRIAGSVGSHPSSSKISGSITVFRNSDGSIGRSGNLVLQHDHTRDEGGPDNEFHESIYPEIVVS